MNKANKNITTKQLITAIIISIILILFYLYEQKKSITYQNNNIETARLMVSTQDVNFTIPYFMNKLNISISSKDKKCKYYLSKGIIQAKMIFKNKTFAMDKYHRFFAYPLRYGDKLSIRLEANETLEPCIVNIKAENIKRDTTMAILFYSLPIGVAILSLLILLYRLIFKAL